MTAEQKRGIVLMRRSGRTLQEVGDEFGITREYVRQILKAQGETPFRVQPESVEVMQVRRMFRAVAVAARHQLRADRGGSLAMHGTRSRYERGCPCDACRGAMRDYMRMLRLKDPPNHGWSGYLNYGCRCDICKRAHSDALWLRRNGMKRTVPV